MKSIVEENGLNNKDFFVWFRKPLLKVKYGASEIQN